MPVDTERRTYRAMSVLAPEARGDGGDAPSYRVSGYATTYDEPYELYEGVFEQVDRDAFDGDTEMSDVIMQYDHAGKVLARQSNGTLELRSDGHGLLVNADLSQSEAARALYEEIKNGLVTRMSFAFTVDREEWDEKASTRTIKHISRLYDVSAVSIPANDATEISARSYADGVIRERRDGEIARAEAKARLRLIGVSR